MPPPAPPPEVKFALMVLLEIVVVPALVMPPPLPPLAAFPVIVLLVIVSVPLLRMPAPPMFMRVTFNIAADDCHYAAIIVNPTAAENGRVEGDKIVGQSEGAAVGNAAARAAGGVSVGNRQLRDGDIDVAGDIKDTEIWWCPRRSRHDPPKRWLPGRRSSEICLPITRRSSVGSIQ